MIPCASGFISAAGNIELALHNAGDAFRAFVLKDMGGLYLDLDIECFQHREHMLYGLDLVLQVNLCHKPQKSAILLGRSPASMYGAGCSWDKHVRGKP